MAGGEGAPCRPRHAPHQTPTNSSPSRPGNHLAPHAAPPTPTTPLFPPSRLRLRATPPSGHHKLHRKNSFPVFHASSLFAPRPASSLSSQFKSHPPTHQTTPHHPPGCHCHHPPQSPHRARPARTLPSAHALAALKMQILRLLAARRAASNVTSAAPERRDGEVDDEGPFFDLDFASCSLRDSSFSSSSGALSGSDSDSDEELDFVISLQRSRSASSPLKFCASEPPSKAKAAGRKRGLGSLRTLSFGARKAAPLYGVGRSSSASARSLRLFMATPHPEEDEHERASEPAGSRRVPSRDLIRRCLARISRRLRAAASPRAAAAELRGLRRLRKCRSASSAVASSAPRRDDDSAVEKQDGIAGAIAHCKESIHRASMSDCDSPLLRSRSDPGKCDAA
ncbi:uncharacterized protein [Triticum aestivum]|nr:uncharacterized protein LOC123182624 [Triticum aestivum]